MKIIHTGDIHLDSPLNSNLKFEKATERKNEILLSFGRLVDYAKENEVQVVIIAGDLFDKDLISAKTERYLFDKISSASNVDFLYLKGNHDKNINFSKTLPNNLKIFSDGFSCFEYEGVVIGSIDLNSTTYDKVEFYPENYNILVAHGTTENSSDEYYINLNLLKNKNINYLALGHIHKGFIGEFDGNGTLAQCGCLEGRGFDECGKKGFILVDTDNDTQEFIEFSSREIFEVSVDISKIKSTAGIIDLIKEKTLEIDKKSIVRIVLTGKVEDEFAKDLAFITSHFEDKFFAFSIKDDSKLFIDFKTYQNNVSLKGEFVKLALSEKMDEKVSQKVITAVLNALNSEELGI